MTDDPIARARRDGRTTLTEAESKTLLADTGVATPEFAVVDSPDAAVEAAERIGFPVVLKVSSPAVTHKSEWRDGLGVTVDVTDAATVRSVARDVLDAAAAEGIDADVLVEEVADLDAGTEIIVGGLRDPSFGPVVLTGLGGVFTEVFEDTAHRLAPIDDETARAVLGDLESAPLLEGYRGSEAVDLDALAGVVRRVGDVVATHDSIVEVDVNPVLATPDGAVALDALVVLDE